MVAGSWDTDVRVWSTDKGDLVARIEDLTVSMFAMDFSPDGRVLAAAGADRAVYLLDAATWKVTRKLTGHPEIIVSLAFSKDGRLLATGGFSGLAGRHPAHVTVWDCASGNITRSLPTPDAVWSMAFSEDGSLLANATGEKAVTLRAPRA